MHLCVGKWIYNKQVPLVFVLILTAIKTFDVTSEYYFWSANAAGKHVFLGRLE